MGEGELGVVCGRYAPERKLGRGGLGEVFLALDTQLNRWVAIKRLHTGGLKSSERAASAINEARHLASLQHPNIVTVFDFVDHEGDVMVVMEFLHGRTLEELEAPLPLEEFLAVAQQSLEGLSAAHSLGMIHRDIKPGNIMLASLPTGKFQTKILDFGLAKILEQPMEQTVDHAESLLGCVFTMTPEQLDRQPIDHRADLYSLGCVFYYALTLRNPFEGDTVAAVLAAHFQHSVYPLARLRPDLPPALCKWVEGLFARQVDQRPANAVAALGHLRQLLGHGRGLRPGPVLPASQATRRTRSLWPWIGAAVGVGCALFTTAILMDSSPRPDTSSAPAIPSGISTRPVDPADREKLLTLVGEAVAVEGTVSRQGENKAGTIRYLNFQGGERGDLALVFFIQQDPQSFSKDRLGKFLGKKVRVTGTVSEYQGKPQIEIKSLSQIQEI